MEDVTLFKQAVTEEKPVATTPAPSTPTQEEAVFEVDITPSKLVERGHQPLVVQLLDLGTFYKHLDTETKSKELDQFITSEIRRLHLKDDESSYKEVVDKFVKQANLAGVQDPFIKLEKLVEYSKIQRRLLRAMSDHEALMSADPRDLSATKLKKLMENRYGIKQY